MRTLRVSTRRSCGARSAGMARSAGVTRSAGVARGAGVGVVVTGCVCVVAANGVTGSRTVISVAVDARVGGVGSAATMGAVSTFRGTRGGGGGGGVVTRGHSILNLVDDRRHIGL